MSSHLVSHDRDNRTTTRSWVLALVPALGNHRQAVAVHSQVVPRVVLGAVVVVVLRSCEQLPPVRRTMADGCYGTFAAGLHILADEVATRIEEGAPAAVLLLLVVAGVGSRDCSCTQAGCDKMGNRWLTSSSPGGIHL